MHGLHVALMNLDLHRLGNRNFQFLADGSVGICQQLLPEIRVYSGLFDDMLQHLVSTSHIKSPDFLGVTESPAGLVESNHGIGKN